MLLVSLYIDDSTLKCLAKFSRCNAVSVVFVNVKNAGYVCKQFHRIPTICIHNGTLLNKISCGQYFCFGWPNTTGINGTFADIIGNRLRKILSVSLYHSTTTHVIDDFITNYNMATF